MDIYRECVLCGGVLPSLTNYLERVLMNKLQRQQLKHKHSAVWYGFVQEEPKKKADISYSMKMEREKLKLETKGGDWK